MTPVPKAKYDMETFDEVLVEITCGFMDKAKKDGKPFFVWHNTTRMHVWTFLSPKYKAMMNSKTNYGLEEAGMAQMDDSVGALLKHLEDIGEAENTIVIFSTDNGAEVFTWPDGGMTPFKGHKGTRLSKVASAFRASPAGRAKSSRARSRTASSPASTGSPPLRRRRQSEHHRRAAQGREARRPDLQEPPGRLQPAGSAAGQGAVEAARVLLFRRTAAGGHPHR